MESFVINAVIGFWLVLFGAMAIFPLVIEGKPARRTPLDIVDDQVISIRPVADAPATRRPLAPLTLPAADPDHRDAA